SLSVLSRWKGRPVDVSYWDRMVAGCPRQLDPVVRPFVEGMFQIWVRSWPTCCATRRNGIATGRLLLPTLSFIDLSAWPGVTLKSSSTQRRGLPCGTLG